MNAGISPLRHAWPVVVPVFLLVLTAQLALVAVCGTDIPFHDQWNIEGQWLYPRWIDRSLVPHDLLQAFNEHRILWTHLLNLLLFAVNGQWDPLVQLVAIAVLRAICAAGLAWYLATNTNMTWCGRGAATACVAIAFLPHLAWHNVLWGIESHAYFSLGFSLLTLALLGAGDLSVSRMLVGLVTGVAGLLAMGPAALVPVSLLGLAGLRLIEHRRWNRSLAFSIGAATGLLILGMLLRVEVPEHAELRAQGMREFFAATTRVLSWPHVSTPSAAFAVNLPVLTILVTRIFRWRQPQRNEDFVMLVAGWSASIGLATAWVRGGSPELLTGVPSRYVDFVILLPLANVWCATVLADMASARWRSSTRLLVSAWCVFLVIGWLGISAEVLRGLILPRGRDREAPVRLMHSYRSTGDAAVFAGQPRLYMPHPNLSVVHAVLTDPRMKGALPPSLQPESRPGPLSRVVRALLRHKEVEQETGRR